ncbi:MAG: transcriptional regulator [Bacteroidetes bacterium]|nr:transcriptional regulator [Bacteroidota bacterium]
MNVTLRNVAEELERSYGNITYHYKTKEQLIEELYTDMQAELKQISSSLLGGEDMFKAMIKAPGNTFELSMKYLFLFKDFVEIRRNFPHLSILIEKNHTTRKKLLKQSLLFLRDKGLLRKELEEDELDYLMELSGTVRTFFFLNLRDEEYKSKDLEMQYIMYTNKLLLPYLSSRGKKLYTAIAAPASF